jgi:hypothetical protein
LASLNHRRKRQRNQQRITAPTDSCPKTAHHPRPSDRRQPQNQSGFLNSNSPKLHRSRRPNARSKSQLCHIDCARHVNSGDPLNQIVNCLNGPYRVTFREIKASVMCRALSLKDSPSLEDKPPIWPEARSAFACAIRDRFNGNPASCFSRMSFSHSLRSESRATAVVELAVASNERKPGPDLRLRKRCPARIRHTVLARKLAIRANGRAIPFASGVVSFRA